MENEKKEVPAVQEISDESLNAVSGGWGRYFCDPCDGSWFCESNLEMNMAGGWVYTHEHSSIAGDPGLVR